MFGFARIGVVQTNPLAALDVCLMKYVKFAGDTNLPATAATYFMEIDERNNMVTRQVETADGQFLWGEWTGTELVGDISDQPFLDVEDSELDDDEIIEISQDTF